MGNELGNVKIAGVDKIIKGAMKKLRVKPEESLYIGDNLRKDLVGAKGQECGSSISDRRFRNLTALNLMEFFLIILNWKR